jgi:WD40 repeat protein/uncharacterized protein YjbI with pentapeptide repeats
LEENGFRIKVQEEKMSKHQAFVDYFTHEFMEELWYLQKLTRGDIPKRKEANPWETFFNITQALLSLAPIPGLPLGFLLSKELISKCIEYGSKAVKLAHQAGKSTQDFLNKMDQVQSAYNILTGKSEAKGMVQQEGPMDLVAIRVLVELLGRGLAERYEHVLTEYLAEPPENQVPLARVAARRIFEYLQKQPLQDPSLGNDLLAQRGRLLSGVILGKVDKSWRERLTDKMEPVFIQRLSEVELLLKDELKKQDGLLDKLTQKFTAEGVLMRSAWYDAKQVYSHSKTAWREKVKPAQPQFGYAYLASPKGLLLSGLKPDTRPCTAPPRDRRYYRAVTPKEIQAYLNSPEVKSARAAKKTAPLSFHDFLRKNGHPVELQAVCHDDLIAIKDWSFGDFTGVDFSGAKITGNVSGTNFTASYLVGVTAYKVYCTEDYPVNLSRAQLGFVDFREAKLPKAQFTQADLSLSNFSGADLMAIQSEGVNWYKTDLSEVKREDLWKRQAEQVKAVQDSFRQRMDQSDKRIQDLESQLAPMLQLLQALGKQKPKTQSEIKRWTEEMEQQEIQLTTLDNYNFVASCQLELKALGQRIDDLGQDIKNVRGDVGVLSVRADRFEADLNELKTRFKGQVTMTLTRAGDVGRKILVEHTAVQLSHRVKDLEFYLPPTVIEKLPEDMTLNDLMTVLNHPQSLETERKGIKEIPEEGPVEDKKAGEDKTVALPKRFDAIAVIDQFLTAEENLLLLLGEPGAGKSLSVWQATRRLLGQFKPDMTGEAISRCWLPIVIELNVFSVGDLEGLIDQQLRQKYGLDEKAIAKLKQAASGQTAEPKVLLMLDGYDELSQALGGSLRDHHELFKRIGGGDWRAGQLKVIVTCRRRFLAGDSEERMIFGVGGYLRYQRYELLPFTREQIGRYVEGRSAGDTGGGLLKPGVYLSALRESDSVSQLVSNPFVLQLFLESLPRLKQGRQEDISNLSRFALYQAFFDQWLEREVRRFPSHKKAALGRDSDALLVQDFQRMAIYLAMSLYAQNRLTVQFISSSHPDYVVWRNVLKRVAEEASQEYQRLETHRSGTGEDIFGLGSGPVLPERKDYMRQAQARANSLGELLPLTRSGEAYQFVHKSLYEYLITTGIVSLMGEDKPLQAGILAFFQQRLIQTEPAVLDFLYDLMRKNRTSKKDQERRESLGDALNTLVERSRMELQLGRASSNAATILNYCDVNLTYRSWAGVQLAEADLSYSVLWGSDLSRANLAGADIHHALLREVKLIGANLLGVRTGERPWLKLDESVESVAFHPGQPWLAVTQKENVLLVNYETGVSVGCLKGHTNRVMSVAFSPDGRYLASGSMDQSCRLWDVTSQSLVGKPIIGHTSWVHSVAFSPDGRYLASGSMDGSCRLWDVANQNLVGKPMIRRMSDVAFSPDGRYLASLSEDNGHNCCLWDLVSQNLVGKPMIGHTSHISCLTFSSDGRYLASGSLDGSCRLWDVASQILIGKPMVGHTDGVMSVAFSPDGRYLASGGEDDRSCQLWDVASQKLIDKPMIGHKAGGQINSVAFSPDGRYLATGSSILAFGRGGDNSCRLWDVASQKLVGNPMTGHTKGVSSVAFSPDGRYLASGSWDHSCRLWDVASQKLVGNSMTGHINGVGSVAFSPDGQYLVSGDEDNSCRIWDVNSQGCVAVFYWVSSIYAIAFQQTPISAESYRLALGGYDGLISFWEVNKSSLQVQLLGMIRNERLPLDVKDVNFTGCQMDALTRRLFEQRGGKMEGVRIVDMEKKDEKAGSRSQPVPNSKSASSSSSSSSTLSSSSSTVSLPVTAFQKKLQELCAEKKYTFVSKRPTEESLVMQFTAADSVSADSEEIKRELISAIKLLEAELTALGITPEQYQLKSNRQTWSLTITGETTILDVIADILQAAGTPYFPSLAAAQSALFYPSSRPPSTQEYKAPTVTCAVQ